MPGDGVSVQCKSSGLLGKLTDEAQIPRHAFSQRVSSSPKLSNSNCDLRDQFNLGYYNKVDMERYVER